MDVFRSEARVELDFLPSLKHESFKHCLSDGDSPAGLPGLARRSLLIIFWTRKICEINFCTTIALKAAVCKDS